MLIELVGVPGAGKSTVAEQLVAACPGEFARVEVTYRPIVQRVCSRPLATAALVPCASRFVAAALTRGDLGLSPRVRLAPVPPLVNQLLAYRDWTRHATAGGGRRPIGVFDEFVLQRVLSVFGYAATPPTRAEVARVVRGFRGFPTLAVFLDVAPDEAAARADRRTEGVPPRMRALGTHERAAVVACHRVVFDLLRELVPGAVVVDAAQSPSLIASVIAEEARKRLA